MLIDPLTSGRKIEQALTGNPRHRDFAFCVRGLLLHPTPGCQIDSFVHTLVAGQHRHRRTSAAIAVALEILAELQAQGLIRFRSCDETPRTRVMLRHCPDRGNFAQETLADAMSRGRGADTGTARDVDDIARDLRCHRLIAFTHQRAAEPHPEAV